MTTIQFEDVDLSLVKLSHPRANKSSPGFKSSYIQYQSSERLCIQTPVMRLPWDVKPKKLDEGSNVSAQLALSFTGINPVDPSCDLTKFITFMKAFDARVKELVLEMKGGLGKKSEENVLDANFRDSVKESSEGQYPPTIQPKIWLQCREGGSKLHAEYHDMDITVYNMNQEKIAHDNLAKNCMAAAIIEPSTAWCSSMGVGVTWVAKQVVVKPIPKKAFAFAMGAKYDVLRSDDNTRKRQRTQEDEDNEEPKAYGYDEDRSSVEEDF